MLFTNPTVSREVISPPSSWWVSLQVVSSGLLSDLLQTQCAHLTTFRSRCFSLSDVCFCRGRKKMSIAFGILYSLSCMTKLSRSYSILMLGRLLAGISTSLLFSVFESWMISFLTH